MYKILFLEEAERGLRRLDKVLARRVIRKLNWLAENAEAVEPKGLRKNLAGFAKLREGDYRVIYQLLRDEEMIIVRFIGHRREIYKNK